MENAAVEISLRPLRLGEILDRAVGLYRHNFLLFTSIIALAEIPFLLVQVVFPVIYPGASSAPDDIFTAHWFVTTVFNLLIRWIFVDGLGAAVLTYAISRRYLHQPTGLLDAYRQLSTRWINLIGILTLFPLVLLTVFVVGLIPCIGWLVAPGLWVFLNGGVLPFIMAGLMIEKQSAVNAILRAWDLSRRRFLWILWFNMVMAVFGWVLSVGPSLAASLLIAGILGSSIGADQATNAFYGVISSVSGTLFNMFFLPIQIGAWSLIYYDLRVRTEGFDLALLTSVVPDDLNHLVALPPLEKWLSMEDMAKFIIISLTVLMLCLFAYILPIFFFFLAALAQ